MLRLASVGLALFLVALPTTAALAQDSSPMAVQVIVLKPVGSSTASGWAWIIPESGQMIVTTLVMGPEPGSGHSNHLHRGPCDSTGGIAYPLTDLTANADGVATATTLVKMDMGMMMAAAPRYVNIHAGILGTGPTAGAGVTCGNVGEMMPMMPGGM
jgi:hypothetical protein